MGRTRIYATNAERTKAYRERNQITNTCDLDKLYRWKLTNATRDEAARRKRVSKHKKERRQTKMFIAIDGEGRNRKKSFEFVTSAKETIQVYPHDYVMLSSSHGHTIEEWADGGLSSTQCFDFLLSHSGLGIMVGFSIGYDINKWLKDLDEDSLIHLWQDGRVQWEGYAIEWLPGKYFRLSGSKFVGAHVTVYDVFGFFQKSFIKSLKDWKIDVPKEIEEGKALRNKFTEKIKRQIKKYNLIECELLVEMMNKVRDAMIEANALPSQWHGAGAIASELFKQNNIAAHNAQPNEMYKFFCNAYYGGRVQLLKQGEAETVYCHDINSAYPAAMRLLPSSIGEWYETKGYTHNRYSLYYVEWKLPKSAILGPFPFRHKRAIHWPLEGAGWYWQPEVFAACNHYGAKIKVNFGYEFIPEDQTCYPFQFIQRLYDKRKEFIDCGSDAQLILKLGINACYGKVAQSIGHGNRNPAFQNYFWAGWITSLTRARIFDLAMGNPKSVISISTDGIVALDKLCEHSKSKVLGGWSVEKANNFFSLQSGVYIFQDDDGNSKIRTRGFSPRSIDYAKVRQTWRKDKSLGEYHYNERRFMGLGSCLRGRLPLWGNWIDQERTINFWPNGDVDINQKGKLIDVRAPRNVAEMSETYQPKLDWFESVEGMEYLANLEQ